MAGPMTASGKCIDVPYLGRDKLPNGVRSYPCREREGSLIFVFPGDPARADSLSASRRWARWRIPGTKPGASARMVKLSLQFHA